MYPTFYGLKEKPFSTSPDPYSLWFGENYKKAISMLEFGILEKHGFLVLAGDAGSGKSTLINFVLKKINVTSVTITISDTEMAPVEFLKCLAEKLEIERKLFNKGAFLIHLKSFLDSAYLANKKVLLIIKEAHNLSYKLLEEIRLLSNFEIDGNQLLNILFVGQREFNQFLMEDKNRPAQQRITTMCRIYPLTKRETAQYIDHHLKIVGATRHIFSSKAVCEVYCFSRGNPRLINAICDLSLSRGAAVRVKIIDADIIKGSEKSVQISGGKVRAKNKALLMAPDIKLITLPVPPKILFISLLILLFSTAGYLIYNIKVDHSQQMAIKDDKIQNYDRLTRKKAAVELDIWELNRIKNNQLVKKTSIQSLPSLKKSEAAPLD